MSALITVDPGNKLNVNKTIGWILLLAILGVGGYYFCIYLLPMLLTIVWNGIKLAIGGTVLAIFLLTICNPKFWRAIKYLCDGFSRAALGWVIEQDPFNIMEYSLEESEKDAESVRKHCITLQGKRSELESKLKEADIELSVAINAIEIAKKTINDPSIDENSRQQAQDAIDEQSDIAVSNKEYIDGLKPMFSDLGQLIIFMDKVYNNSTKQIRMAKKRLSKQRDLYTTVTTASSAIKIGWRALKGDANINRDAEIAINALRRDIGEKLGEIKNGIKLTSEYMNNKDLTDAAKLQSTLDKMSKLDLANSTYSETITDSEMGLNDQPKMTANNKYFNSLNTK